MLDSIRIFNFGGAQDAIVSVNGRWYVVAVKNSGGDWRPCGEWHSADKVVPGVITHTPENYKAKRFSEVPMNAKDKKLFTGILEEFVLHLI